MNEFVQITKDEAESLIDFIEVNIFEQIKNDPDTDNMVWLYNVCSVWKKCQNLVEEKV